MATSGPRTGTGPRTETGTGTGTGPEPEPKIFYQEAYNQILEKEVFDQKQGKLRKLNDNEKTKLKELKTELDMLGYVFKQKQIVFSNSLNAPILDLADGQMIGGSNQSGGGFLFIPVTPDNPIKTMYSTARLLLSTLKNYESEIINAIGENEAKKLQNLIVGIHSQEQQLYEKVYKIAEIKNALRNGFEGTPGEQELQKLYEEAIKSNKEAENKRTKVFKMFVPLGG